MPKSKRILAFLAATLLLLSACAKKPPKSAEKAGTYDSLPPAALTERAQRDSARAAQLLVAYYDFLAKKDAAGAARLFYPESIRVATPNGGIEVEGQSTELAARLAVEESTASRVRRIELLRRASVELLEQTYRESWVARWVPDRPDSTPIERRFHLIQPLGRDTRWLGRMDVR
jgi:hypothetical protein